MKDCYHEIKSVAHRNGLHFDTFLSINRVLFPGSTVGEVLLWMNPYEKQYDFIADVRRNIVILIRDVFVNASS